MTTHKPDALTVALIVKNESEHLAACLDTVHDWVDEILLMDSGSQDDTLEIARRYPNARVLENLDWQGFGAQRRLTQTHVQTPWIFWIDADERVTPELRQSIQKAIAQNEPDTVYSVSRLSWVFGRFIRHSGWYPDRVVRLYRANATTYSDSPVHEHVLIPPNTKTRVLNGDLLHYTYRDLQHYLVKSAHYAHLWAQQRHDKGRRASLSQGMLHAIGCFLRMYVLKVGFLDGRQGLLLALLSAHSTFAKYANLWLLRQPNTAQPDEQSNRPIKPRQD